MRGVSEEYPAAMNNFQKNVRPTFWTPGAINCKTVLNCQEWYFKLFEINHSTLWSEWTLFALGLELNDKNSKCKSKKLLFFFFFGVFLFCHFIFDAIRTQDTLIWHETKTCDGVCTQNHYQHLCAFELHLILVCCTTLALRRCLVTLPAVDQNHQQVSCLPKYAMRVCAEPKAPVTMRPLCSSGCQPVCPRVLFPF